MNNMNIPRKKQLTTLYSKGYSMKEIGEILGMATGKIHKYFKIYNIIPRKISNEFSKIKISEANKGVSRGKGKILSEETKEKLSIINSVGIGRKVMHNGYVRIYFPDHPKADKRGWILEHDLIMECNIGRWLNRPLIPIKQILIELFCECFHRESSSNVTQSLFAVTQNLELLNSCAASTPLAKKVGITFRVS